MPLSEMDIVLKVVPLQQCLSYIHRWFLRLSQFHEMLYTGNIYTKLVYLQQIKLYLYMII